MFRNLKSLVAAWLLSTIAIFSMVPTAHAEWVKVALATEKFTVTQSPTTQARYGTHDGERWTYRNLVPGVWTCLFSTDPAPGAPKRCEVETMPPRPTTYISKAGDDSWEGTEVNPKQSIAAAQAAFNSGRDVLFKRGDVWNAAALWLDGRANTGMVIDAYGPASLPNPVLITDGFKRGISFDTAGADGGYTVRNLTLKGINGAQWGIFLSGDVHDVKMENMDISGFMIGVNCGTGNNVFQLLNSHIYNNSEQGTLWGCSTSVINGNRFVNNGFGSGASSGRNHNVYLTMEINESKHAHDITINGNYLSKSSMVNGKCSGVEMVIHGWVDGLTIDGNTITNESSAVTGSCRGINVDSGGYGTEERFTNVKIRNNVIENSGDNSIGCGSCVGGEIDGNVISIDGALDEFVGCVVVPDQNVKYALNAPTTANKVRNNNCRINAGRLYSTGISYGDYNQSGGEHNINTGNVIQFGPKATVNAICINRGRATFDDISNNTCTRF